MNEKGYTLIELLLVLMIMSVLMAMTFPAIDGALEDAKLRADANIMAQELRNARFEAVFTKEPKWCFFYKYDNSYRVNNKTIRLRDSIIFVDTTGFSGQPPTCVFHPTGAVSPAGTITLQNERNSKYIYIIINPVVSRVRVSNYPPESW